MPRKPIPEFKSEAEEAAFWYANRDNVEAFLGEPRPFDQALADKIGLAARPKTEAISLRLPGGDLSRAKAIAAKKGLPYQTYLKMLIHEALEREAI